MAANYNCLLFDLDGTLLDFKASEKKALKGMLEEFKLQSNENVMQKFSQINKKAWQEIEQARNKKERIMVRRFIELLSFLNKQANAEKMNERFMVHLTESAEMFAGADEMLAELAEFATLAVISNSSHQMQVKRLEKSGLLPFFDNVFVSDKLGVTKPSPKFFELALKKLGVANKQKVLIVGDSLTADIKGGISAKIDTCWCNFDENENTTHIKPTYTVQSFAQIKLFAIGEEELKLAQLREKRHII